MVLSTLALSCTKELKYTKEQILSLAQKADSTVSIILPKSIAEGVSCTDYSEGCISAHIVRVQNIEMIAVEFMTEKQAIYGAKKIKGYYVRNWVFDDVVGEPVLERFVTSGLEAKKP